MVAPPDRMMGKDSRGGSPRRSPPAPQSVSIGTPMILSRRVRPSSAKSRMSCADAPSRAASAPAGGVRDSATAGSRYAVHSDDVAHRVLPLHGTAQEPDPVADVTVLVVVDPAVPGHESGQQALALHEAGRELVCGQPERRLQHEVVDRHERHLRGHVSWMGCEALVRRHQPLVADRPERREICSRARST